MKIEGLCGNSFTRELKYNSNNGGHVAAIIAIVLSCSLLETLYNLVCIGSNHQFLVCRYKQHLYT